MLAIAGADKSDNLLLTQQHIQKFPCSDLINIDQLWIQHSQGHFGFSIIYHIYQQYLARQLLPTSRKSRMADWRSMVKL